MKNSLDKAIALHKKHMKGTEATNMKSQMELMNMMTKHKKEMTMKTRKDKTSHTKKKVYAKPKK